MGSVRDTIYISLYQREETKHVIVKGNKEQMIGKKEIDHFYIFVFLQNKMSLNKKEGITQESPDRV